MKIALIGSNGLLGCSIKEHLLKKDIDTLLLTHNKFEITNPNNYKILSDNNIDLVINTAAFLGVEPCENNPNEAFDINTKAVRDLAIFCNKNNIVMTQISTDGVFDGKEGSYDELSIPQPVNLYGLTKYNGEQFVKNLCKDYYIFRIPILFGLRENTGNIFIEKMYNLYKEGQTELKIADDIISRPSYSNDIAEKIVEIIITKKTYGIYHIFNGGEEASLYDFAKEFFEKKGITNIPIHRAKAKDFSQNELGVKPLNTSLQSIKTKPLRDWKLAIKEYCNNK